MAARKTFGDKDKVGTPRGYVDKAARDKVEKAMEPVAEVGKNLLYFTPGLGQIASGGRLGARIAGAVNRAFSRNGGSAVKATEKVVEKAVSSSPKRAAGGPRPARGVKPGSARQDTLDSLKQGPKNQTPAKDVKPGSARQATLDSLKQGPKKPLAAADMKSGGARAKFLERAGGPPARKPRPGEKKFIGPANKPKPGDKKFIGPENKPSPGDKRFIGPQNKPKPGEGGFIGPVRPANRRTFGPGKLAAGAVGAGAAGLGYMAYKDADKAKGDTKPTGYRSKSLGAPESKSFRTSKTNREKAGPLKSDFAKMRQGTNVPGSPTYTGNKKSGGTKAARKREKPLTAFERQKKRQYEREGYGGRSMTSDRAKSRVESERSFKFKDLFKK